MTVTWNDMSSITEGSVPLFIGEPPFTADGIVSATIPQDQTAMQTVSDQFSTAGWQITDKSLLTTLIEAGDYAYPILIGTARAHRLHRIWIAAPALVFINPDDTRIEFDNLARATWLLLQRHLPQELSTSSIFGAHPFLATSCRPNIPLPIQALQAGQPSVSMNQIAAVQVGIRSVLDEGKQSDMNVPWCAYSIAHAIHDLQTLYSSDPSRFHAMFGEIRPLQPGDAGLPPWPDELTDFTEPPDTTRDISVLTFEGDGRFRDGTEQGAFEGELLLREAAASEGERAGSAINTLVFSCLDTKKQRIEALSFLLKGVLQEQSFEAWNSLSNLSTILLESDETWAGICLAQIIFELDDLRLDSEASFLLGQAAMQLGLPGVARNYLNIGLTRNPANYEDRIQEVLKELPPASAQIDAEGFRRLSNSRLAQIELDSSSQVAPLIDLLNVDADTHSSQPTPEHPYITLARKAQRAGNSQGHPALLALCSVEGSEHEAAYAYSQLVELPQWKSAESRVLRAATHLTAPFPLSQSTWIEIASVAVSLELPDIARQAISAALNHETPKSQISIPVAIEAVQIAASVSPDEVARESLLAVLRNSPLKAAKFAYLNLTHDELALDQALRSPDIEQAEAAAKNPFVNASNRTGFWDGLSSDLAWIAASSDAARPTTLQDLSSHAAESVRRAVARNPRSPAECLIRLASDQAWAVREAVLSNPHAPDEARAAATLLNS